MRLFGLIGYPLTHSFSESYFEEKFKKEKINNCRYKNFPLEHIETLPYLIRRQKNLLGLNVTSPYKQSVIRYINELDPVVKQTGSVNVIRIERSNENVFLKAYNTDVFGFKQSLNEQLDRKIQKAMILGSGGAAQSVAYGLLTMGIEFFFVSRKEYNDNNKYYLYSNVSEKLMNSVQLIVNATTVGLYPDFQHKPDIPYDRINETHILFDLIYNPAETQFLKAGKLQGAKTVNGYDMLIYQAEKAWEIFSGSV